jgi:hypothetical protein
VAFYAKAMAIRYNKSNTSSVMSKAAASQPPIADQTWHAWVQITE